MFCAWIQSSKNYLVLKGFYFLYIFRELNEKFVEAGFPPIQHTYDVWHLCKVNICYILDIILPAFLLKLVRHYEIKAKGIF
jgi:hypothetical protein